jgi:hypothetical protein
LCGGIAAAVIERVGVEEGRACGSSLYGLVWDEAGSRGVDRKYPVVAAGRPGRRGGAWAEEDGQLLQLIDGRIDYNPSSSSAFAHISLCSSASLLSPLIDLPLDHKPLLARLDSNSSINSESVVKYI